MNWLSRGLILIYGAVILLLLVIFFRLYAHRCRQTPIQMIASPSDVSLASAMAPPLGEPSLDPHQLHLIIHHPRQEVEMVSLTPQLSPLEHQAVLEQQRKQRHSNLDDLMV